MMEEKRTRKEEFYEEEGEKGKAGRIFELENLRNLLAMVEFS